MSLRFSGAKLEDLRGRTTQHDLAAALRKRGFGTTQTTVSRWESGQVPRSAVLPALAAELGVTVDELFDEDEAEAASMTAATADSLAEALRALVRTEVRQALREAA